MSLPGGTTSTGFKRDSALGMLHRMVNSLLSSPVVTVSVGECARAFTNAQLQQIPASSFPRPPPAPHLSAETRVQRLTLLVEATRSYSATPEWRDWINELLRWYIGGDGVLVYAVGVLTPSHTQYDYLLAAPAELRLNIAQRAYALCAELGHPVPSTTHLVHFLRRDLDPV